MEKPVSKSLKIFAALMLAALVGVFAFKAYQYLSNRDRQEMALTRIPAAGNVVPVAPITTELLEALNWQDVNELTRRTGTDAAKISQILRLTSVLQHPVAVYTRGFVLMLDNKPQRALDTFDRLSVSDIPGPFLYAPYRLHRQMRPLEPNRYLAPLREAMVAGEISPLIKARVQAQEGDSFAALSNYMQTDPARWVDYDVECLKKIGWNSGLQSEVRRVIAGALKSGRVSAKIDGELRELLTLKPSESEVRAFKRQLKEELIQDSSAAKIAVSSMNRLLETRKLFLQRDYKSLLAEYRDADPLVLPTESVMMLFLSAVELGDRLESDRWGQELKRRHPTQEVINWVTELKTSAR
ncbi:MAG: hypothetical protein JRF72_17175 [Deltaproteobacteria bacterium]|nr:hypothetical protein [Deltaproteobacteria bacterium]